LKDLRAPAETTWAALKSRNERLHSPARNQGSGMASFATSCQSVMSFAQCCLTLRSSGAPTACRTGHPALGLRPILRRLSSAPRVGARLAQTLGPANNMNALLALWARPWAAQARLLDASSPCASLTAAAFIHPASSRFLRALDFGSHPCGGAMGMVPGPFNLGRSIPTNSCAPPPRTQA